MKLEDIYQQMETHEPYGTRELADKYGLNRRTAHNYLDELAENNHIRKKRIDARRVVWIRED